MSFLKKIFGPPVPLKTVSLPGGSIRVPNDYAEERQDDGTTVMEMPGSKVILRVTLLFAEPKQKNASPVQMADYVRKQAAEKKIQSTESPDGKVVYTYDDAAKQDDQTLLIRYWIAGIGNCMAIFSATILPAELRKTRTIAVLAATHSIVESFELSTRTEYIESENGTFQATVSSIPEEEAPKQSRRPFNDDDRRDLAQFLQVAQQLRARYGNPPTTPLLPAELDLIFARWFYDDATPKPDAQVISQALGSAFGEYLVSALRMHWEILTDEYGTAWAVGHAASTITAFPIESVRKRIDARTTDFFMPVFHTIKSQLENESYKRP